MKLPLLLLFFVLAIPAHAFNPQVAEPVRQYDPIIIDGDILVQREFLGELTDAPETFEFYTERSTLLKVQVFQLSKKNPDPFGLIVVRKNDDGRGVTEIKRLNQPTAEWESKHDPMLGMQLIKSSILEAELGAGTYRVEISTPDNAGKYMIVFGDEELSTGYFAKLANIAKTQHHFGLWPVHLFGSAYVHYPLGIIVVILGIFFTWKRRKQITHVA